MRFGFGFTFAFACAVVLALACSCVLLRASVLVGWIVLYWRAARWGEKKGEFRLSLWFGFLGGWSFVFVLAGGFLLAPLGWLLFVSAGGSSLAPRGAGVAPVRGGTFFLCRGKERRQRKPLETLPGPFRA
jgi:hypothetical protein